MRKILVNDFCLSKITDAEVNYISRLDYPVIAVNTVNTPETIRIAIRSGYVFLEDGRRVRNIDFKREITQLIARSSYLKTTIDCNLSFKGNFNKSNVIFGLLLVQSDLIRGIEFEVTVRDMVFENSPKIKAEERFRGMDCLFRKEMVDRRVRTVRHYPIYSREELANYIEVMTSLGINLDIVNPKSGYNFGTFKPEEQVRLKPNGNYRGIVKDIIPATKIVEGTVQKVADYIITEDRGAEIKVTVPTNESIKVWKTRHSLIGKSFIFSGNLLYNAHTPVMRTYKHMLSNL